MIIQFQSVRGPVGAVGVRVSVPVASMASSGRSGLLPYRPCMACPSDAKVCRKKVDDAERPNALFATMTMV